MEILYLSLTLLFITILKVKFSVVDAMGNRINTKTIDKEYKVLNHAFGEMRERDLKETNLLFCPLTQGTASL